MMHAPSNAIHGEVKKPTTSTTTPITTHTDIRRTFRVPARSLMPQMMPFRGGGMPAPRYP
jgi:hypothetical protein